MFNSREFIVSCVGFSDSEMNLIDVVLGLTKSKIRAYSLSERSSDPADIILLNSDVIDSENKFEPLSHSKPVVVVTKNMLKNYRFQVLRPLAPTRLLKVLDEVTIRKLHYSPEVIVGDNAHFFHKISSADAHDAVASKSINNAYSSSPNQDIFHTRAEDIIELAANNKDFNGKTIKKASIFDHDYSVLVVDDNKTVRQAVGSKIHALKINTVAVSTGEKAIELAKKYKFDLIFLDIELPEINGYAVCKQLKANKHTKQTPICMLTGKTSSINKIRGKMSGCDDYLTKPVTLREMLEVMHKYMPKLSKLKKADKKLPIHQVAHSLI